MQPAADIERVVREVLADMGLMPQAAREFAATHAEPPAKGKEVVEEVVEQPVETHSLGDVVVLERVVTLAGIGNRLSGARRLIVPPRAVVTPAVRDELRHRNIAIAFEDNTIKTAGEQGNVVLSVLGSRIDPAVVVDPLRRAGIIAEPRRFDCLIRATDDMASRLAEGDRVGVILSNHGAVALCLANRHASLRAVAALDTSRVATDAASVGANLLVVEPKRLAPNATAEIVTDFCRTGPSECPEALRERLETNR